MELLVSLSLSHSWIPQMARQLLFGQCLKFVILFRTAVETAISGAHKFPTSLTLLLWRWLTVSWFLLVEQAIMVP